MNTPYDLHISCFNNQWGISLWYGNIRRGRVLPLPFFICKTVNSRLVVSKRHESIYNAFKPHHLFNFIMADLFCLMLLVTFTQKQWNSSFLIMTTIGDTHLTMHGKKDNKSIYNGFKPHCLFNLIMADRMI